MNLLLHRRADSARSELDELRRILDRLRSSDPQTRFAVGAGVCLANIDFLRRFSGIEAFRRIPAEDQKRFCQDLNDLELGLRSQDPGMAIGVGLYRIWLTDALAERYIVADLLGEELAELSRRAASA